MRQRMSSIFILVLCAAVALSSAGCEPLRKKFTRQKKKNQVDDSVIPVLEPVEYAPKVYGAQDAYVQHYSLFKIWFSDFQTNYQTESNYKKSQYNLDASLKEVDEMTKLLKSPAKEELAGVRAQLQYIRDEYDKSAAAFRNTSRIASELRSIDSAMRRKFKPELVKEQLSQ